MNTIYWFDTKEDTSIQEVGGKGQSLIRLTGGGFSVPYGAVLGVSFFSTWIQELKGLQGFAERFEGAADYSEISQQLKTMADTFDFSPG